MPAASYDQKALDLLKKCEAEGRIVRKLVVDGKRIEIEFDEPKPAAPDHVKW